MEAEINTPYFQNLIKNRTSIQSTLENLIEKHQILPVGNGFIDLIIIRSKVEQVINELEEIQVAVEAISWWCLCKPETKDALGCPHGGGGPQNRFGEGWFSECYHLPMIEVKNFDFGTADRSVQPPVFVKKCNDFMREYLADSLPNEPFFSECLHPGLWLHVPKHWERQYL